MRSGDRVLIIGGPWNERIGEWATVVQPPLDGTYPQPGKSEVLLLLDDDPLSGFTDHLWWTCVISRRAVSKP